MTGSTPEPMPQATVIIPVRNDARGIDRCLAGIARQCVSLEVIVIDDGSSDGTGAVAQSHGVRVLNGGGRGAAAARNLGAQAASCEILLFTDGDCIPCPGWAKSLVEPIAQGHCIATKGSYRSRQSSHTAQFVQVEYEERYERMRQLAEIDFLDTYSLGVRRSDLLAIGGFDEAFAGASVEDQEMSFRLHERGRFLFVSQAVVEHLHADRPGVYFRKKLRIGRGKATLIRRHRERLGTDSHTPRGLVLQVPAVWASLSFLLVSPWISGAWLLAFAAAVSPAVLSLPLLVLAVRRQGPGFAGPAMALSLVRGWSLSLGFAWGLVSPLAKLGATIPAATQPSTPQRSSIERQLDEALPVTEPSVENTEEASGVEREERDFDLTF